MTNRIARLLAVFALLLTLTNPLYAQSMGATVIIQGGNTANVTAGHALQVDILSVNGTGVSGMTAGSVPVTIVSGAGSGGTASADEAAFTEGSTNVTLAGCYFKTSPAALTTGQGGGLACTAARALFTNLNSIGGNAVLAGNGVTGTGSQRVTIASDNTAYQVKVLGNAGGAFDAATGAAPPANAVLMGGLGSGATGGFVTAMPVADTYKNINVSTATTTLLVTGVASRQVRIGAMVLITAGADNIAFIEGTGATCGTGTAGMAGGTTSASGFNFAANGGITVGSGIGTVLATTTAGDSVCIVTSANVQVSGGLQYTIF